MALLVRDYPAFVQRTIYNSRASLNSPGAPTRALVTADKGSVMESAAIKSHRIACLKQLAYLCRLRELLACGTEVPNFASPNPGYERAPPPMKKTYDPVATTISAIENVSRIAVTRDDIRRLPFIGEGEPSHIMAPFSDVNYATLPRLAIVFGISDDDFACAYIHARKACAAANPDLDAFVLEMETVWQAERAQAGGEDRR